MRMWLFLSSGCFDGYVFILMSCGWGSSAQADFSDLSLVLMSFVNAFVEMSLWPLWICIFNVIEVWKFAVVLRSAVGTWWWAFANDVNRSMLATHVSLLSFVRRKMLWVSFLGWLFGTEFCRSFVLTGVHIIWATSFV